MKLQRLLSLFAGVMLLLMFSCENLINEAGTAEADTPAAEEIAPEGTSKVSLTFPLVNPSFMESLSKASDVPDRAYLFVKYAVITVTDSLDAQVYQTTLTPMTTIDPVDFGTPFTESFYIPWGADYTVTVDIYDTNGGTLLVSGSAGFDVGFEMVNVSIALTPDNPTVLTGTSVTGSIETSIYNSTSGLITYLGDEAWLSYTAGSNEEFLIQLMPDSSVGALLLADSNGITIGDGIATAPMPGIPTYISTKAGSGGATFYIGMGIFDRDEVPYDDNYILSCAPQSGTLVEVFIEDDLGISDSPVLAALMTPGEDPTTGDTPLGDMESVLMDGEAELIALTNGTNDIWEGTAGSYDLYIMVDVDGNYTLSDGDYAYIEYDVALSGSGVYEVDLLMSEFNIQSSVGGSSFQIEIEYFAEYDGASFNLALFPDGTTINDLSTTDPDAYAMGTMSGGNLVVDLYSNLDSSPWFVNGDYEMMITADVDNNGDMNTGDYFYFEPLTVSSSPDSSTANAADFGYIDMGSGGAPLADVAGVWYDLQDGTDTPLDDSDDMEVVLEIDDGTGSYHEYDRRHAALASDYFTYLDEDVFYELRRGNYDYSGGFLTFTPTMINMYAMAILEEVDVNPLTSDTTEEELMALGVDMSTDLILHDKAYYQTNLVDEGIMPQEDLDDMFLEETVAVTEEEFSLTSDGSSVSCMRFNSDEDLYKPTYLDTDADAGDQSFRTPYPTF